MDKPHPDMGYLAWLQSASSLLDATKINTMDLQRSFFKRINIATHNVTVQKLNVFNHLVSPLRFDLETPVGAWEHVLTVSSSSSRPSLVLPVLHGPQHTEHMFNFSHLIPTFQAGII